MFRKAANLSARAVGFATCAYAHNEYKVCFPAEDRQVRALAIPFYRMQIVDSKQQRPWYDQTDKNKYEAREVVDVIHHAAADPSIGALHGTFGYGSTSLSETGWADLEEVRNAIKLFNESHRRHPEPNLSYLPKHQEDAPIGERHSFAYATTFASNGDGNKDYYLASVFSMIIVQQHGMLNLFGLFSQEVFLRDMLRMKGIKMHVFKHGAYKNAPNIFTESGFTREHRENVTHVQDGIQRNVIQEIMQSRSPSLSALRGGAELLKLGNERLWKVIHDIGTVPVWMVGGFIYGTAPYDSFNELFQCVSFKDYSDQVAAKQLAKQRRQLWKDRMDRLVSRFKDTKEKAKKEEIALLKVDGSIGNSAMIKLVNSIRKLRNEENTKCVVVRVSTPGGDVDACETILQELKALKLPVVVSFGNMSTSGGYYISAGADRIFASNKSITGSIGVFGIRVDLTGLAAKQGMKVDHVAGGPLAGLHSPLHPMTPRMKKVFADNIDRYYAQFKNVVAEGRSMSIADVEAIAGGRVWTGFQAKEHGLVDEIGGLHDAVAYARRKYTTGEAELVVLPKELTWLEWLAENDNDPRQIGAAVCGWAIVGIRSESAPAPTLETILDGGLDHKLMQMALSSGLPGSIYYASDENTAIRCLLGEVGAKKKE